VSAPTPPDPARRPTFARLRAVRGIGVAGAGRVVGAAREAGRAAALEPEPAVANGRAGKRGASKTEPPFDPTTWSGALITMAILAGVLWVIQIVNASLDYRLDRYGLRPRDIAGLEGIVTSPFLHTGFEHLLANTGPFILIGWAILLSGVRPFLLASAIIIVIGGLATWLVAPSGIIVGASGLVMGWLGYLLARAYFSRRVLWIIVAVLAAFFFSGLLGGLLPTERSGVSWQGHLAGFVAGIFAAWVLHPRTPRAGRPGRRSRTPAVS
jgi:membrane associated rhomboid family serine protease